MKKIELVIKLSEDMYNLIMENVKITDALTLLQEREVFIKAIQNGTVLPEKHDGLVLTTDVNRMCSKYATDCGVEYSKMWNVVLLRPSVKKKDGNTAANPRKAHSKRAARHF